MSTADMESIQHFMIKHRLRILKNETERIHKDLCPVDLKIENSTYTVQINDEYNDLRYRNDILNFILVFRELKIIEDSSDFLHWCALNDIDADTKKLVNYYRYICSNLDEISACFVNNKMNYFISDLDFQLNAGAIQLLRK